VPAILAVVVLAGLVAQTPTGHVSANGAPDDATGRMRAWYFAEGDSRHDFQTFFTLLTWPINQLA
jgi:hypothetical protein